MKRSQNMTQYKNKCKQYSLREDLMICQEASSGNKSLRALARVLADKLGRPPQGIYTRIKFLRGAKMYGKNTDNGVRLHGTARNLLIDYGLNSSTLAPAGPKFKRMLSGVTPVSEDTLTITVNGATMTGSVATLRAILNLNT